MNTIPAVFLLFYYSYVHTSHFKRLMNLMNLRRKRWLENWVGVILLRTLRSSITGHWWSKCQGGIPEDQRGMRGHLLKKQRPQNGNT
jgi:hypothetical protein